MKLFFIALMVVSFSSSLCYVIKEEEDSDEKRITMAPSRENNPEDINKVMADLSKYLQGDNGELVKEVVKELDEELSDNSKEFLDAMRRRFMSSVVRMTEGGQLYREQRRENVLKTLFTAFEAAGVDADTDMVTDITSRVRRRQQQRQQKAQEFESSNVHPDSQSQITE